MDLKKIYELIDTNKYPESHGADKYHPGMSLFYYTFVYTFISKKCVVLGSGSGFVPKILHYAQSELIKAGLLQQIDITLIDADIPEPWGERYYSKEGLLGYPFIKLINCKTDDVYNQFENIDYLHVDADHSEEQVYKDLCNYGSRMSSDDWIITCHDTVRWPGMTDHDSDVYNGVKKWSEENNHICVNIPIGRGTALIMPNIEGRVPSKLYCEPITYRKMKQISDDKLFLVKNNI